MSSLRGVWTAGAAAMVAAVLATASDLRAGDVIFVCDSTEDGVYRLEDVDGDGSIAGTDEVGTFYDDASDGPDLSVPSHLLVRGTGVLLLDGGTLDTVIYLQDQNDDGDAQDADELTVFYDNDAPGPDLSTPNTLAASADGRIYVADDGASVKAIIWLSDQNDDGDALDEDEAGIFYDTTAASPEDPLTDPESLAVAPDGSVYVGDTTTGDIYRLTDTNDDGDALDEDEATLFYAGADDVEITDIDTLLLSPEGALYVIDEDTGTILVLTDSDDDGLATGEEVQVLVDGSDPDTVSEDPNDAVLLPDGTLLVVDGALDALIQITDDGGQSTLFDDDGELLSAPSGIAVIPETPTEPPPPPPPPPVVFIRGDSNNNGTVAIDDAFLVLTHLLGTQHPCPVALDINDDDTVTLTDAITLLQYLYVEGPPPEAPFPIAGEDPTPGDLPCRP